MPHPGFEDFKSYHLLASGHIDAIIEAKTNIWDIAPVSLIVQEAGGESTDLKGNPISHSTNSIIASNKHIHDDILNYFI